MAQDVFSADGMYQGEISDYGFGIDADKWGKTKDQIMRDNNTERQEILLNTRLLTRDGRRIGNAIVRRIGTMMDEKTLMVFPAYKIKTDYGTKMKLTEGEIRELFYVADVAQPDHKHFTQERQ